MYKIVLLLFMFCVSSGLYGQVTQEELDRARKEATGDPQKEKAYYALLDSAMTQNAVLSLEEETFVLEAERVTFRRGNWRFVTSSTNFILVNKDKVTVQIAFDGAPPGPNGLGGITLEGTASNVKTKTDRRGNRRVTMNVTGASISAQIEIELPKGSYTATARVNPNFNSNFFTLTGNLVPLSQSTIFKGRAF